MRLNAIDCTILETIIWTCVSERNWHIFQEKKRKGKPARRLTRDCAIRSFNLRPLLHFASDHSERDQTPGGNVIAHFMS